MVQVKSKNVIVIGSGGREHAIVWKLSQSPKVNQIFVLPGNGGTALTPKATNVDLPLKYPFHDLISFARSREITFVFVGPEQPLVDGITDVLTETGIPCFGPSSTAAQIESSKAFSKSFMTRHNIPTATYQSFSNYEDALKYVHELKSPFVLKASGLASGKGVVLPETTKEAEDTLYSMMITKIFGLAGDEVVIEDRLEGPEVSVLAFSDGETISLMPPAQDHKRAYDGDQGPNTGGMGAYSPVPILDQSTLEVIRTKIIEPTIHGLKAEGRIYVGVIYAGLMLTQNGPYALEFNCRFGDPETQVLLPLLITDLVDIVEYCLEGKLDQLTVEWKSNCSAATVVMASHGYPGTYPKGKEINGLHLQTENDVIVFHAGTSLIHGTLMTSGGRVLAITGIDQELQKAVEKAYKVVQDIHFEGAQFRKDIAYKALKS